jgi:hypothetical protein
MKLYALLNIILCFSGICWAQVVNDAATIEFGSKNLSLEEPLIISVVLRDSETRPSVIFPEIKGLEKRSKSAISSMNIVDGKKVVIQTISQEYFAPRPGTYLVPDFTITVNGLRLHSEESTVIFTSGSDDPAAGNQEEEKLNVENELADISEGIFLSIQTDKRQVYIREGFALRVSLYIAENTPVQMEFYRFSEQLQGILKTIRPTTCWEENVGVEEIIKRSVTIRGKRYTEYNMYQARFFPITTADIVVPAVELSMLVIDNSKAINVDKKVIRTFRSKSSRIVVRPLPAHPLRDQVAVGQYGLKEILSAKLVYPGESVRYMFKIEGTGNIAAIPAPVVQPNSSFDIYPPEVSQLIKRSYSGVVGEKTFDYFVVPRKDGTFPLGRYFQWVYFDPLKARYDTLHSTNVLQVHGEDYKLNNLSLTGSTGLYDNLETLDSSKESFDLRQFLRVTTNAIVLILLVMMFWVIRK